MRKAILQEMQARLQEAVPFEVRYAHSGKPIPSGNQPFLYLDVKDFQAETPIIETSSRIRYPVTATVVITALVPLTLGSLEVQRILAAYVLPCMIRAGGSVSGFSLSQTEEARPLRCHKAEVQFRLKGVYTAEWEEMRNDG